jgi:SNF2 family DNA or RNA helicase
VSIQASLEGDQIRVKFPYDVELLDRIRSIPGRRWDMASKSWIVPKPQWRALRQSFDDIQVPPEQEEALKSLESARWPSIDRVEGFSGVLYPFQAEAVGFLVERKRCLLADEMGLGKTVSSIAALLELRRRGEISRALIFCPKTIIYQWMTEFKRFTGEDAVPIVGDRDQRAESLGQASKSFLNITNYETVLRMGEQLADLQPDVVVLDEAQRIGSYDAKTTRQIRSLFKPPLRWALTGTPMENSLQELHSIMSWIDPGVLGPWFSFQSRYLIYGGFQGKQIVGSRNLDQLHAQI